MSWKMHFLLTNFKASNNRAIAYKTFNIIFLKFNLCAKLHIFSKFEFSARIFFGVCTWIWTSIRYSRFHYSIFSPDFLTKRKCFMCHKKWFFCKTLTEMISLKNAVFPSIFAFFKKSFSALHLTFNLFLPRSLLVLKEYRKKVEKNLWESAFWNSYFCLKMVVLLSVLSALKITHNTQFSGTSLT